MKDIDKPQKLKQIKQLMEDYISCRILRSSDTFAAMAYDIAVPEGSVVLTQDQVDNLLIRNFTDSTSQAIKVIQEKNERIYQLENSLDTAVKQKAKDILSTLMQIVKKSDGFLSEEVIRIIAKQNNVEVE